MVHLDGFISDPVDSFDLKACYLPRLALNLRRMGAMTVMRTT
ncbi:hypothetical protein [Roseateles sp.]|nr:hypothetical protein [Roseateles sp.]